MKSRSSLLVLVAISPLALSVLMLTVAYSQTSATLTVASGIPAKPGVVNPLGEGAAVLLRGSSPPDLRQREGVAQMKSRAVAEGRTDASGKVTFPGLAPGEYYVVLIPLKFKAPIPFGMSVVVKPGSNSATMDQRHAGMGMSLDPASRASLDSALREAGGGEVCKPEDLLVNPDCINRQLEKQKLERQCPIKYTGPRATPGVANASLSVVGMGYVYNYTERDRKTGVVTNQREIERGNFINTTLYLLDKNAEDVLAEAGLSTGLFGELGVPTSRLMTFDLLDVEDVAFPSAGTRKELTCVMDGIKSHAVATVTTDANARGTFPKVPAGSYYVFGRFYRGGKRPAGGMFWNHKVELRPGSNVLQLSADKAVLK